MDKRFYSLLALMICLCLLVIPIYANADSTSGLDDIQALDELPPAPQYTGQYNRQVQPNALSTQPIPKAPWYSRMFKSATHKASLPINQVPKVPEPAGKETDPLSDPLIRLTKAIKYHDQVIYPGFYILSVQQEGEHDAILTLTRQQETLLTVPAEQVSRAVSPPKAPEIIIHESETKASGDKHKKPHVEEAEGSVEVSSDGQTIALLYHKAGNSFRSIPLEIAQPEY